ncbi:MAG: calcium-binding protein, partial [Alphaproteobacteria bacterium]|nr:calcium-binding protein [Alphaproteobacteria bacterium]
MLGDGSLDGGARDRLEGRDGNDRLKGGAWGDELIGGLGD